MDICPCSIEYFMKLLSTILLTLSIPTAFWLATPPAEAKKSVVFTCTDVSGRLATAVQTKKGNVPLVYWDSAAFNSAGFSPQVRCQKVTQRFTNLYGSGQLKYLAVGKVRSQSVICGLKVSKASCNSENMLFTIKPESDPRNVLRQLNAVRNRAANSAAVNESSAPIAANPSTDTQVDVEDWLNFANE
jgi:Circadian oscillating protein COP23